MNIDRIRDVFTQHAATVTGKLGISYTRKGDYVSALFYNGNVADEAESE